MALLRSTSLTLLLLFHGWVAFAVIDAFSIPSSMVGVVNPILTTRRLSIFQHHAVTERRMGELTKPEQTVYDIMQEVSDSGYSFRVVVVGKGAILESTMPSLGPVMKVTQSPSTGANMLTMASSDQGFEFHVQLVQVSKIVLVEKETPAKTLRIIRLLNDVGESMSSLILADSSELATSWYHSLVEKHGNEIQL